MLLNILQCTGEPSATENYPAPSVRSAEVEKPGLEPQSDERIKHLML